MINKRNLKTVRFLTDARNYKILKILLEQTEGISIKQVADKLKINKSMAKGRLLKFAQMYFCEVHMDIPKYEEQRTTKSYKLMYMIKPHLRTRLNNFVDYIEEVCKPQFRSFGN